MTSFRRSEAVSSYYGTEYGKDIHEPPARVDNADAVLGDKTAAVGQDAIDRFEALARTSSETASGEVLRAMSRNRLVAKTWAHAMTCDQRIPVDL